VADCEYTVPDPGESGDALYGPRACDNTFWDWALKAHPFLPADWDEGWGHGEACDVEFALVRTMAAIWCLSYSTSDWTNESYDSDILHWGHRYVRETLVGLIPACGELGGPRARTSQEDGVTELFRPFFYEWSVPLRAGTLLHEARHAEGVSHDGTNGRNDSDWGYNGAWRWNVCWLALFYFSGENTSKPLRMIAKHRANIILSERFDTSPDFEIV